MQSEHSDRHTTRRRKAPWAVLAAILAGVVVAGAGLAYILLAPLPGGTSTAEAKSLGRGIIDYRLETSVVDLNAVPAMVDQMGAANLRAGWTRVLVHWATLQPSAPGGSAAGDANGDGYDDAAVKQLDTVFGRLHDAGITIVLSLVDVPKWASDKAVWETPPAGYKKGVYQPFYAPAMTDPTVAGQFKALGKFLAKRYAGTVKYYECWNEPNQGMYLYPQTPASATNGGGATYLEMLKQWYAGVKSGSPDAQVIAGATAPRGRGDAQSTPPQAFAKYLKSHGVTGYMDGYSHHPYTPGGSTNVEPGQKPNNPARCVTLGNLSQITKLFPGKPFLLTEFGYNTEYSQWFGVTVTPTKQAQYLRDAYAYVAAHYPQVKALLWFLVDDWQPQGQPHAAGVYMGVRTAAGVRKQSWYAFAGGNALTFKAPASAKSGAGFTVSGKLTYRAPAGGERQTLTVQVRKGASGAWKSAGSVKTALDGSFSRSVKQSATSSWRVVWGGICESAARTVRTP